ncbi:MAG: hypothetical protein U1E53_06970 [Dongiaceae bacterium]
MPPSSPATAHAQAAELAALVDILIPGDARWPAASTVGVQGVVAARLLTARGEGAVASVAAALAACGGPLAGKDEAARIAVVAALERTEPALFAFLRNAACFAYYEHPVVVAVVQSLGQPYVAMPHAEGYALPPFDPARDTPRHGRGRWTATDAVRRVDLSALPHLAAGRGNG